MTREEETQIRTRVRKLKGLNQASGTREGIATAILLDDLLRIVESQEGKIRSMRVEIAKLGMENLLLRKEQNCGYSE